ncbi:MAG: transporter substrate-binding domain-containing protein [Clostridiales bacterium]|nr:transporter substrate-binding domain-containing protein [Clostridiales bacterium]
MNRYTEDGKMKKIIPIILTLVMIVGLAACAPKAPSADPSASASPAGISPSAEASPSELASSQPSEAKILKVGMECAYAPYNWSQPDDSNGAVPIFQSPEFAYGYDVMMAKYICEKLGYTLEVHKLAWDSIPLAVQSGDIDVGICGQSITADRLESMDFSTPYYYASIVVLTKADSKFASATGLSGLAGATCTSQINTVWYDVCLPQIKDASIQPAMDDTSAMLVSLNAGNCDLVVTDAPTAMAAVMVNTDLKLLDFTGTADNFEVSEEEINIGISIKKGNTALVDAINGVLETLTQADFDRMMQEAIKLQPLAQ